MIHFLDIILRCFGVLYLSIGLFISFAVAVRLQRQIFPDSRWYQYVSCVFMNIFVWPAAMLMPND